MKKTNALRLLEEKRVPHELVEYQYDPDNLNVERIAEENQLALEDIYKTLVLQTEPSGIVVALVPGNRALDRKALAKISEKKRVDLLAVAELFARTGYVRGGCCPLCMTKPYPVYLDQSAETKSTIYVNAGVRGLLVGLSPEKLIELTEATLALITR